MQLSNVVNAFVRGLTCFHLGFSCVHLTKTSKSVTVTNCSSLIPVSRLAGGRRYAFNLEGQRGLVRFCVSDLGRHNSWL